MIRIRHTVNEAYAIYSYLPCQGELFKDVKRWYPHKHYRSKQSALTAIKRIKENAKDDITKRLVWKIVWLPYPFCSDDQCITVYNEDTDNE